MLVVQREDETRLTRQFDGVSKRVNSDLVVNVVDDA
jgi:hypothetical protein